MEPIDTRIFGQYRLCSKMEEGWYATVYLAKHVITGEEVAMKMELMPMGFLYGEWKLLSVLDGGTGIPKTEELGDLEEYEFLPMELLGSSLEDLYNRCGRRFSLKTVLMLADQMISRIEYVHSKSIVHCSVKPDNFVMGLGKKQDIVYLTEFGLGHYYRDPTTLKHNPLGWRRGSIGGTSMYCSLSAHYGVVQCRKDDLESLGYVLVYLLKGSLPWQDVKAKTMRQMKANTSIEEICEGCPEEFVLYLTYCRSLAYGSEPDYNYLRALFLKLLTREGHCIDHKFDWNADDPDCCQISPSIPHN